MCSLKLLSSFCLKMLKAMKNIARTNIIMENQSWKELMKVFEDIEDTIGNFQEYNSKLKYKICAI